MQGLVSMFAASAVLSAGLVAGLAAADASSGPTPAAVSWNDPPARATKPASTATNPVACAPSPWPTRLAGCTADGRRVRVIALTQP